MSENTRRIAVIGVGNEMRRDDGVGIIATRALKHERLPQGVEVVEGGPVGMELLLVLQEYDAAVVIQAADLGQEPGHVASCPLEELDNRLAAGPRTSTGLLLTDLVELGQMSGEMPEIMVVAVQPGEVSVAGAPIVADGVAVGGAAGEGVADAVAEAKRVLDEIAQDTQG